MPGHEFENGGIVAYHDPNEEGRHTHMEIIQPDWKKPRPYEDTLYQTGAIPIRR